MPKVMSYVLTEINVGLLLGEHEEKVLNLIYSTHSPNTAAIIIDTAADSISNL